jgi:hypothetical protein
VPRNDQIIRILSVARALLAPDEIAAFYSVRALVDTWRTTALGKHQEPTGIFDSSPTFFNRP